MVTVLRAGGFSVRIYKDDHPPAHVHVFADGVAKIDLLSLEVVYGRGMTKRDLARALTLVRDNREALLNEWRNIHG